MEWTGSDPNVKEFMSEHREKKVRQKTPQKHTLILHTIYTLNNIIQVEKYIIAVSSLPNPFKLNQ